MRRAFVALVLMCCVAASVAASPQTQALRVQLKVQEQILEAETLELRQHQAKQQEAWVRVRTELSEYVRGQRQGESLDTLGLRDDELRQAEADLMMHLFEGQRLRRAVATSQMLIDKTREEIRRLRGEVGSGDDPLSGTWRLVLEPGGLEGLAFLQLEGTLVQGTYRLEGGWTGSLRGTLVAGKVRLERIDAQVGFAAILYGRLVVDGEDARLQGSWEATQLASGLPSAGAWMAERVKE